MQYGFKIQVSGEVIALFLIRTQVNRALLLENYYLCSKNRQEHEQNTRLEKVLA